MHFSNTNRIWQSLFIIGTLFYLSFTIEGQFYTQKALKMFIPILAQKVSLHPMTSSDKLFKDKNTPYTAIETAYYIKTLKKAFYNTEKKLHVPYSATEFQAALPESVKTLLFNNPLYFKTHLSGLLPNFSPEFLSHVLFATNQEALPQRMIKLQPKELNTYLEQLATQVGWRFLVDGLKQKAGETAIVYDSREPGCLVAMAKGFQYLMSTIKEPLTFDHIIQTHTLCAKGIKGEMNRTQQTLEQLPFRETDDIVEVDMLETKNNMLTPEGLKELSLSPHVEQDYTLRYGVLRFPLYGSALKKRVETVISDYHQQMQHAKNQTQKLQHIITLIATLERLHPFFDANCRTICVLTLNRELLKYGFGATLLTDPNRFHGYSHAQLFNEVVEGFDNYNYVKKHGHFKGENLQKTHSADNIALMRLLSQKMQLSKTKQGA